MPRKRKVFNLHVSGPQENPRPSKKTKILSTRPPVITNKPCNTQSHKRFCFHERQDPSKKDCRNSMLVRALPLSSSSQQSVTAEHRITRCQYPKINYHHINNKHLLPLFFQRDDNICATLYANTNSPILTITCYFPCLAPHQPPGPPSTPPPLLPPVNCLHNK